MRCATNVRIGLVEYEIVAQSVSVTHPGDDTVVTPSSAGGRSPTITTAEAGDPISTACRTRPGWAASG